jgi:hypothetical protein
MAEKRWEHEPIHFLEEIVCQAIPEPPSVDGNGRAAKTAPRKLFSVETRFEVQDRGTILGPGLISEPDEFFRVGQSIQLRRPDGSELRVSIRGLDFFHPGPNGEWAILVGLEESEVPIGTEVWSV